MNQSEKVRTGEDRRGGGIQNSEHKQEQKTAKEHKEINATSDTTNVQQIKAGRQSDRLSGGLCDYLQP